MTVSRARRYRRLAASVAGFMLVPAVLAGAAPATSLRGAMEQAVQSLLADLFTERPAGEVVSLEQGGDFIVRFPGAAPPVDAEYLIVRPPDSSAQSFGRTVGAARIVEPRGELARARLLWADQAPARGDRVAWPSRVTVVLLPTDAGDRPELAARARRLDHWLELELVADRRLRVLRADERAAEVARAERLRKELEYGLFVAPLLVSTPDGVEIVLRVRSAFTEQTLAQRRGLWSSAPPAPSSDPPAVAVPAAPAGPDVSKRAAQMPAPPASPYGPGIQAVQPAGVKATERPGDYVKIPLPEALNAVVLADVDGDRRPEIVGITDQQVIVYKWTGRTLETLVSGEPLPAFTTFLSLDAGDVNGDGRDEIVLTAVHSVPRTGRMENTLESSIIALRDGRLKPLAANLDRHLRVFHAPGQPPVVLAQKLGHVDPFDGPIESVEWKGGRYQRGSRVSLPGSVSSVYGFAGGDLDGDGRPELALVGADGRLRVYGERGEVRWESEDDLGQVDVLGFSQTPRFPDYRGRNFDASAELLAVWRAIPRRVLVSPSGPVPEVVTVANARGFGLRVGGAQGPEALRGRAVGYGWDAERRTFAKRWESSELGGSAFDLALGDLDGDGRVKLLVLSGTAAKRSLEIFTLYTR